MKRITTLASLHPMERGVAFPEVSLRVQKIVAALRSTAFSAPSMLVEMAILLMLVDMPAENVDR